MAWFLKDCHFTGDRLDHLCVCFLIYVLLFIPSEVPDGLFPFSCSISTCSPPLFLTGWTAFSRQIDSLLMQWLDTVSFSILSWRFLKTEDHMSILYTVCMFLCYVRQKNPKLSGTYDKTLSKEHQTYLSRGNLFKFGWIRWKVFDILELEDIS